MSKVCNFFKYKYFVLTMFWFFHHEGLSFGPKFAGENCLAKDTSWLWSRSEEARGRVWRHQAPAPGHASPASVWQTAPATWQTTPATWQTTPATW